MSKYNNDEIYRKFALNEDMWKVIFTVGLPISFYQSLNLVFKLVDSMMASYVGSGAVSAVAFLVQINNVIAAIGGGLAVGGSLEISKAYGTGDFDLVKKRMNSLFFITTLISAIIIITIPFSTIVLKILNTPDELVEIGSKYFSLELFNLVLIFYNNVYISIERVRGNGRRILFLNIISIFIKLSLSAFFIYVFRLDIHMIAAANIISQLFLFLFAIKNLNEKNSIFKLSLKDVNLKSRVIKPIFFLSFPIMIEKMAFSLGKVIVNSISAVYGATAVGALGISNNLGAITTSPQLGFQEASSAIISQNLGAGNKERAFDAFKKVLAINIIIGVFGLIITLIFVENLSFIFSYSSKGNDAIFQKMIISIYRFEAIGSCIPLAINSSIIALFLGFGYSKLTLLINFCRVFVFRIPVMWFLQNKTNFGYETCGIVMMISNFSTSIFSIFLALLVVKKIKKEEKLILYKVKSY